MPLHVLRLSIAAVLPLSLVLAFPLNARIYDPLAVNTASRPEHVDLTVHDAKRQRDIPIRIYLPTNTAPAPVVLFSHGLGGTRVGSVFLAHHWVARGYVSVFLQHPGSDDVLWRGKPMAERMKALNEAASLQNYLLRVEDVPAVLNQLESWNSTKTNALFGRLDMKHIGMSGHSFGAVTAQAVSGQTLPVGGQKFTDPRIKAAIIMSPSSPTTGTAARAFGAVKIPWLLMTGTKDLAPIGHADMKSRLAVYPALHGAPKYELVLKDAEHSIFIDFALPGETGKRNPNHQKVIQALSTAFWDAYLRGDAEARAWLNGPGPRSLMEADDKWQHSER